MKLASWFVFTLGSVTGIYWYVEFNIEYYGISKVITDYTLTFVGSLLFLITYWMLSKDKEQSDAISYVDMLTGFALISLPWLVDLDPEFPSYVFWIGLLSLTSTLALAHWFGERTLEH